MAYPTLLLFLLASIVTIATPGPTVLLALSNGSRFGVRAACWGMGGAVVGDMLLLTTAAAGLGAMIAASEVAFHAMKWLGAAYLAYLGWKLLRAKNVAIPDGLALGVTHVHESVPARKLFVRSLLVAVTNPKALLFMSAFLPQFIDTMAPLLPQYTLIMAILMSLNLLAMLVYAVLGARVTHAFRDSGLRWLNRISGGTLIGLAGVLALYRRGQ